MSILLNIFFIHNWKYFTHHAQFCFYDLSFLCCNLPMTALLTQRFLSTLLICHHKCPLLLLLLGELLFWNTEKYSELSLTCVKLLYKQVYLCSNAPLRRLLRIVLFWRSKWSESLQKANCVLCSETTDTCRFPAPVEAEGTKLSCKARPSEQARWGTSLLLCPHLILLFCL